MQNTFDKAKTLDLAKRAVFSNPADQVESHNQLRSTAFNQGMSFSSIHKLYTSRGQGIVPSTFSVPAFNLRGLTIDTARSIFRAAIKLNVGAFIFEIARTEMKYTNQNPLQFSSQILAAAIIEEWTGPIYLQCDHFQAKAESPGVAMPGEIDEILELSRQAINAGFFNIDIDMSTLVDLAKNAVVEQQLANIENTARLITKIRPMQPEGVVVSLGGEIGHIGGKNSTVEEFEIFMDGVNQRIASLVGLSKISIQSGSDHGGVVNPDGSLSSMQIDFDLLEQISKIGQQKYQIAGAVQHGASTLLDEQISIFPKIGVTEVHLATGLQNLQMDHPAFPNGLLDEIYEWIDDSMQAERKPEQTDAQFHYRLRKKAWGKFQQRVWDIPQSNRDEIATSLQQKFEFYFKALSMESTKNLFEKFQF